MGFGVLFFGYFLAFGFSLSKVYFFADIIGAVIMLFAFTRLAQYNTYYKASFGVGVGFILLCGVSAARVVMPIYPSGGAIDICVSGLKLAAACVMLVITFLGAGGISGGAGEERLVRASQRQITLTAVYYVLALGMLAVSGFLGNAAAYVGFVLLVYYYFVFVTNLVFVYKCFATLCPADEDEKKDRNGVLDKMDYTIESITRNTKKYGEDSIRLAIDEAAKLEKNGSHHHKKKKK